MRPILLIVSVIYLTLHAPLTCNAHTPYMACYDNGDDSISCYAEFSDGSSAAGNQIRVEDSHGELLHKSTVDDTGEYNFARPQVPYTVIFDAGPGHVVKEKSTSIE